MNILRLQAIVAAITLSVLATSANAASVTLNGPGVTTPGSFFDITLEGDFTDVGLFGGGVDFGWNNSLVTLVSTTLDPDGELNALDAGLSCPGAGFCPPTGASNIVLGWSPSGANVLGLATGTLASLNFQWIGGLGAAYFTVADDLTIFGGMASLVGQPIAVNYNNYCMAPLDEECPAIPMPPVPIPAAAWLFGSGLLGLIGIARRRKTTEPTKIKNQPKPENKNLQRAS